MNFSKQLNRFDSISELFHADCPQIAFLLDYPTSNQVVSPLINLEKYIIHDPFPPQKKHVVTQLGPHHLMLGWGNKLPVSSVVRPETRLLEHWARQLGQATQVDWQPLDFSQKYITQYPHASMKSAQHIVNPATLHRLHSKMILAEIPCQQPAVLPQVHYPCLIKLSHGYANYGNFFISDFESEKKAFAYINQHWPSSQCIATQWIKNIEEEWCCQFYLNKAGQVTWLGVTEQVFDHNSTWCGSRFTAASQDEMQMALTDFTKTIARFLHHQGYWGMVGYDVLLNNKKQLYLVDINPRFNGSTPFLLSCRWQLKKGYALGRYFAGVQSCLQAEQLLACIEKNFAASSCVLSIIEEPLGGSVLHLQLFSASVKELNTLQGEVFTALKLKNAQSIVSM